MGNIWDSEPKKFWYVFVDNNYDKSVEIKLFSSKELAQEYEDYIYHNKDPRTNDVITKIGVIGPDPRLLRNCDIF